MSLRAQDHEGESCISCIFFQQKGDTVNGFCQRNPPQVVPLPQLELADGTIVGSSCVTRSIFPTVHPETWCGEYLAAEATTADLEAIIKTLPHSAEDNYIADRSKPFDGSTGTPESGKAGRLNPPPPAGG